MAWIEFHDSMPDHPKTIASAGALKVDKDMMIGKMCRFWVWAYNNREDGFISDSEIGVVAEVMRWFKKPQTLFDALCTPPPRYEHGFLDRVEGGYMIHGWDERVAMGREARERKREQTKERVARHRAFKQGGNALQERYSNANDSVTPDGCNALQERYVTPDVTQCNAGTVPYRTYNNNNAPAMTIEEEDAALGLGPDDPQDDDVRAEVACGRAGIVVRTPQDHANLSRLVHAHTLAWVTAAAECVGDMADAKRHMGMLKTVLRSYQDAGRILEPGEFGRDKRTARNAPAPPTPPKPREYYTPPDYMTGGDAT